MKDSMVLFGHIHKSGSTTFKWIMRNSFGLRHLDHSLLLLKRLCIKVVYTFLVVAKKGDIVLDILNDLDAMRAIDGATFEDRKLFDYFLNEIYRAYGGTLGNDLARLKEEQASFNMLRLNSSHFQSRANCDRLWVPFKRRKTETAAP